MTGFVFVFFLFLMMHTSDHTGAIVQSLVAEMNVRLSTRLDLVYVFFFFSFLFLYVCMLIMCVCACVRAGARCHYSEYLCMLIRPKCWKVMAADAKAFGQQQQMKY